MEIMIYEKQGCIAKIWTKMKNAYEETGILVIENYRKILSEDDKEN